MKSIKKHKKVNDYFATKTITKSRLNLRQV